MKYLKALLNFFKQEEVQKEEKRREESDDWCERLYGEGHCFKTKPEVCPLCGSKKIATVIYGLVDIDEEIKKALDAGEIALGGCVRTFFDEPDWKCSDCGAKFYKK